MTGAPNVRCRKATRADRPLLDRLVRAYAAEDLHDVDDRLFTDALDSAMAGDPLVHLYVIEADDVPAGYMALTLGFSIEAGGRDAFVDELYVEPDHRGRGIATRALAEGVTLLKALGCRAVHLVTERHNLRAKALYVSLGWEDKGRTLLTRTIA